LENYINFINILLHLGKSLFSQLNSTEKEIKICNLQKKQIILIIPMLYLKTSKYEGEKPGLVVRAEDSRPRGRGFKSRRILDGCKRCWLLHTQ